MELFNENSKLATVIEKDPSLLPVINRLGVRLGFGDRTIREICNEKKIDLNFFVETINVFHYESYFPEKRLIDFSVSMVIDYLIKTHLYYKEFLVPENDRLIELFLSASQTESKENGLIRKFYSSFKNEFIEHINFEEKVLFPYIIELNAAVENQKDIKNFLKKYPENIVFDFEAEHLDIDNKIDDLKNIIIKYLPPNYDQNRGNAFLSNIFLFEKDLKNHSRIEDHILLPKVKQLENLLRVK